MKKICMVLLFVLTLVAASSAHAEMKLDGNKRLTDKALLAPIEQTEYSKWHLYQPTALEISGLDLTKDDGFVDRKFFPVVAVKEEQAVLILLYRQDGKWSISNISTTALNRPSLTLYNFEMDENHQPDDDSLDIRFEFIDGAAYHYTLYLTASDRFLTRFDSLDMTGFDNSSTQRSEDFFADICSIGFNDGFNFAFTFISNRSSRLSFSVDFTTDESVYDNFATFNLNNVPLSLYDVMKESAVLTDAAINEGKILMKQFANENAAILCEIADGTSVLREQSKLDFQSQNWLLVIYEGKLGYLPKSNIIID
jgi:hypothetical protein